MIEPSRIPDIRSRHPENRPPADPGAYYEWLVQRAATQVLDSQLTAEPFELAEALATAMMNDAFVVLVMAFTTNMEAAAEAVQQDCLHAVDRTLRDEPAVRVARRLAVLALAWDITDEAAEQAAVLASFT